MFFIFTPSMLAQERLRKERSAEPSDSEDAADGGAGERPWEAEKDKISRADTGRAVIASIGAALLIGGVFIAAFAIVIFLMIKAWT